MQGVRMQGNPTLRGPRLALDPCLIYDVSSDEGMAAGSGTSLGPGQLETEIEVRRLDAAESIRAVALWFMQNSCYYSLSI